jgi:Tol biopolymer transport system component/serine/threonine protein kinase
MGEVYRARDTRLGRTVAVKVLPPGSAADPERRRRFEHEARAASALNHPHICSLHDIGQAAGVDYLVLELVEGETLAARLAKGPLSLEQALTTGAEIAEALAAAHRQGVVHRDLKPANVMLTESGAKLLDFGLAKLRGHGELPMAASLAPTGVPSSSLTVAGTIIGTLPYMAPEQLEGKPADARTDIWALGTILYEMVTGRRAFAGDSQASLIASIISVDPPPLSSAVKKAPRTLEHLVAACLAKDPGTRRQSAHDIAEELRRIGGIGGADAVRRVRSRWLGSLWAIGVAAALVMIAVVALFLWRTSRRPPADLRAETLTSYSGIETQPSFSPDGTKVAFVWNGEKEDNDDIYVKQIGAAGPPMRLTKSPAREATPAWSPDDRWIAFSREQKEQGTFAILLVSPLTGPERLLAEAKGVAGYSWLGPGGLCWTPDGKWLIFSERDPGQGMVISAVSAETGERRRLTGFGARDGGSALEWAGDVYPSVSPDGKYLAFSRGLSYVRDLYVMPLASDLRPAAEPVKVTDENYAGISGIAWAANGREVVYGAGSTFALNLWRVSTSGKARPDLLSYATREAFLPTVAHKTSRLAYAWRIWNVNIWRLDIGTGERTPLIRSTYDSRLPQYSPDGRKIAFQSNRSGNLEVWVCDADGSNCLQLTNIGKPLQTGSPRWSPDGRWIAFDTRLTGKCEVYVIAADGGTQRQLPNTDGFGNGVPSWSPDGRWIYFVSGRSGRQEIWRMPATGGEAVQITRSGAQAALSSPDGKFIYYATQSSDQKPSRLWRARAEGGEEQEVVPIDLVNWGSFGVTSKRVYYVTKELSLQFQDLATGRITTLATVPTTGGLAVSPDDRFIVWAQLDRNTTDLMLVEGFR